MSTESNGALTTFPQKPLDVANIAADVLAEIFFVCSIIDSPNPPDTLGWVKLAHVNKRWRQILLELPCLWARIVCLFPRAFKELLARSREAPIALDYRRCRSQKDVSELESLLPRARTLSDVDAKQAPDWSALLPGKTLCAAMEADLGYHAGELVQKRAVMPTGMMHMPALRRLTMRNLYLRASTPNLRSLTLELNRAFPWGILVSLTDILALLATAPLLERLTVRGVVASSPDDLLVPVPLVNLQEAHLQGYSRLLARLWSSIDTSLSTSVEFELLDNPCVQPCETLLGAAQSYVSSATSLSLEHRTSMFGNLLAFVIDEKCSIVFPCSNVPAPILSTIASAVAEHARTLRLRIESSCYTVDDAAGALASLKHVDTVSVCGAPTPTLLAAVREGVLPKLDTVVIEGMKGADKAVLADALRERGVVLRRLIIRGARKGEKASQDNVPLQAVVSEFVEECI
ncbi:hypothetical protein PENSPDRAFT_751136 [Peniophora sp. CONT]|nr:hypothetical protein PENSPDRAFT_751136 [Peniophora sp. CONT]